MLDDTGPSLDDYRQRLRSTLDAQRAATSGNQTLGYSQPNEYVSGEGPLDPNQLDGDRGFGAGGGIDAQPQQPMASPQAATKSPQSTMGLDAVGKTGKPPPKLVFKEDRLPDVKTPADLVDAATPKSLNTYMNWYNREVANINQTYDNMHAKLGIKPDENRALTRKEKFGMLMEFGLNLIKASQGRQYDPLGAVAVGVGATLEGQDAKRKQEGLDYDAKSSMIEGQRMGRLKEAGTYGAAMKSQAEIDMRGAQQTEATARMAAAEGKAPTTLGTDQGMRAWNKKTGKFEALTDEKGQPLTNFKVGVRGGIAKDMRPMQQKLFEFFVNERHMDPDTAEQLVLHKKTGDPRKDYLSTYNKALTASFGDVTRAKEAAQEMIKLLYPEGTDIRLDSPAPPARPGAPKRVASKADYEKLPSGTVFIDPNGKQRTKR